jgi:hypothetical protein
MLRNPACDELTLRWYGPVIINMARVGIGIDPGFALPQECVDFCYWFM